MRLPVLTLVALALATPAAAQMAYRNVFPDGRVVYSDRPLDGAAAERPIAPPPPTTDPAPAMAPAGAAAPAADPAPAAAAAPAADPVPAAAAAPTPPAAEPAPAAAEAPAEAVPGARWPPPPDARPIPVAAPMTTPDPVPAAAPADVQPAADRMAMLAAANQDVRAAQHNLAAAQAILEAGREPQPGERTGLARGGSRLNETYWGRQRQLETAVADAQARLDQAVAERNAKRF
jgi:hypothetical protein